MGHGQLVPEVQSSFVDNPFFPANTPIQLTNFCRWMLIGGNEAMSAFHSPFDFL
jgi:hypothetical protein